MACRLGLSQRNPLSTHSCGATTRSVDLHAAVFDHDPPYSTTIQLVVFDTNFTVRASAGLYQFEPDCEPVSKSTRKTSKSFPPIAMLSFATTRDLRVSLPAADKPCACQLNLCSCESPTHIGNLNMLRLGEYAIVTFGLEVAGPENSPPLACSAIRPVVSIYSRKAFPAKGNARVGNLGDSRTNLDARPVNDNPCSWLNCRKRGAITSLLRARCRSLGNRAHRLEQQRKNAEPLT